LKTYIIAQFKSNAAKILTQQLNSNVIQMLEVNTLGTVRVTKAFLPLLRESQGRVVCVASMAGNNFASFFKKND
jgi:short-subunit dehydrogenase